MPGEATLIFTLGPHAPVHWVNYSDDPRSLWLEASVGERELYDMLLQTLFDLGARSGSSE